MLKKSILLSKKIRFKRLLLMVSVLLATACTFIVMMESYSKTNIFIENEADKNNKSNLIQMEKKLANKLYRVKKITEVISTNQFLIDSIIEYENRYDAPKIELRNKLNTFLIKMTGFSDHIESVSLLTDSLAIDLGSSHAFTKIYQDIVNAGFEKTLKVSEDGDAVFYEAVETDNIKQKSNMDIINKLQKSYYFSKTIKYEDTIYGRIFILLKPEAISEIFMGKQSYIICNRDNKIIWKAEDITDSDEQLLKEAISSESEVDILKVDANNKKVYLTNSSFNDWKLIYIFDRQDIRQKTYALGGVFVIIFIVTLLVAFLFSGLILLGDAIVFSKMPLFRHILLQ